MLGYSIYLFCIVCGRSLHLCISSVLLSCVAFSGPGLVVPLMYSPRGRGKVYRSSPDRLPHSYEIGMQKISNEIGIQKISYEIGMQKISCEIQKISYEIGMQKISCEIGIQKISYEIGIQKISYEIGIHKISYNIGF